jgi:hypothetical protein
MISLRPTMCSSTTTVLPTGGILQYPHSDVRHIPHRDSALPRFVRMRYHRADVLCVLRHGEP